MSRLDQSRVVEASAGTGKTTALVTRAVCDPYEEERAHEKWQAELLALKDLRGLR